MEIPASRTLVLLDGLGTPFGYVRVAPDEQRPGRYDCIFDLIDDPPGGHRSEVRWLQKRDWRRWSEHRFKVGDDGVITISKAGFTLELAPDEEEGGYRTVPPAPLVRATWQDVEG